MIAFFGFTIVFLVGITFLFLLHSRLSILLKVGLAFPAGFGVLATFAFVFDLLSVPIVLSTTFAALLISLTVFLLVRWKEWKVYFSEHFRNDLNSLRPKSVHLSWLLFFGCLCFVIYGITFKTFFWPTSGYDSIAGYDYVAKEVGS